MQWRFIVIIVAGTLAGSVVQRDLATGLGMQSLAAVAMSAAIVFMLLRTRA